MTKQLKAILIIAENPKLKKIFDPVIDIDRKMINWDAINYSSLSGGEKTAVSWAYSIWTDSQPPNEKGFRDLFEDFASLDREIQQAILTALAFRHGTFEIPGQLEATLKKHFSK